MKGSWVSWSGKGEIASDRDAETRRLKGQPARRRQSRRSCRRSLISPGDQKASPFGSGRDMGIIGRDMGASVVAVAVGRSGEVGWCERGLE